MRVSEEVSKRVRALAALGALLFAAAPIEAVPVTGGPDTAASTRPALSFEERLAQPVTADFQEVDFGSAIEFLAENSSITILLSEKAKTAAKPVTVHLVAMPLDRALNYLLKGQGLFSRRDGQAIWVATREEMETEPMETRVFFLSQGAGLFATFQPPAETRESVALQSTAIKKMTTIKDIISQLIPEGGKSSILLDERNGALVVTHTPYYLQQIDALLARLDVVPAQVLIETRFIEVTLTQAKEWALDGALSGNAGLTKTTGPDGTQGPALQLSSLGSSLARGTKIDFSDFTNQTAGNALNLTLQGILSGTQYQAVLHALAKDERTKTLSAPRVTTLNNQTATIKIVTEFVYSTRYQPTVTRQDLNGDGKFDAVVNGVRETRFVNVPQDFVTKDLGILLHVTPSVGSDLRTITLAMEPEVSEKKTDDTFGGEVTLPRFTERKLNTSVVIDNGETVMLGGLMKDTAGKTVTKVPVLGSIPILGALFRKSGDSIERSNLLIFVTASLVNPSGARLVAQDRDDANF